MLSSVVQGISFRSIKYPTSHMRLAHDVTCKIYATLQHSLRDKGARSWLLRNAKICNKIDIPGGEYISATLRCPRDSPPPLLPRYDFDFTSDVTRKKILSRHIECVLYHRHAGLFCDDKISNHHPTKSKHQTNLFGTSLNHTLLVAHEGRTILSEELPSAIPFNQLQRISYLVQCQQQQTQYFPHQTPIRA